MKTPDYLSYDRYKKKKKNVDSKNNLLIFVVTFFITLLLFTIVAKALSPNVDVTIGDDSETDAKTTGLGIKKFVDERLKMIQMDDNSASVATKSEPQKPKLYQNDNELNYNLEQEEKVNIPTQNKKADDYEDDNSDIATVKTPPRPAAKDLSVPFSSPKMSKVLVGHYATMEQAKVAQEILVDSGINITPFVRKFNGAYTLQVGSYGSRDKAEELSSELQRNNFPAKIIQE